MDTVQSVIVTIDGQNVTLSTTDGGTTWSATATAPSASSFNLTGGYYPLTVTATYDTGASTTVSGTSDTTLGRQCRLVVKEKYKPTITMLAPATTNGAYLKNASQNITFRLLDNSNGQSSGFSGIDLSTLSVHISSVSLSLSTTYTSADFTNTGVTGGYECTKAVTLADADDYVITVDVSDNDGNSADQASVSFIVDTDAPMLSITSPADNMRTNNPVIPVSGTTSDSSPVTIEVEVDGTVVTQIPVDSTGAFSGSVTLSQSGSYSFVVIATDASGNVTRSPSKSVYYSDAVPVITSVTLVPNPVDGGRTYTITVLTA